ncbi:MAG: hypothetical protein LDL31_12435, partial [Prosthecobacter sp.]|nr:hypothetical protein [Prosthecobacter sp.]
MSSPASHPALPQPSPPSCGRMSAGPWLALAWAAGLWAGLRFLPQMMTWQALASACLLSLPIAATGMYLSAVAQCRRLTWFASQGVLFRWLSGRWLRLCLWSLWAGLAGLFLLLEMRTFSRRDWLAAAATPLVFWPIFAWARRVFRTELKPYLVSATALRVAQWLTPGLMVLLTFALARHLGPVVHYESSSDAVQAARQQLGTYQASPLLAQLTAWMSLWSGAKAYVIGCAVPGEDWAATCIALTGLFILYSSMSGIWAFFLIPRSEFRRAFALPSEEALPGPISARRMAFSVMLILLPLAIIVAAGCRLEQQLLRSSFLREKNAAARRWVESHLSTAVDSIGGQLYQRGTLAQLTALREEHLATLRKEALVPLQENIHAAFGLMETRVDDFLDEYYSLSQDYKRLGSLVTGNLRAYLQQRLEQKLGTQSLMQQVDLAYQNALRLNGELDASYQAKVQTLLAAARLTQPPRVAKVMAQEDTALALKLPRAPEIMAFETRLGVSAGAGALSGALAGAVTARVVNRVVGGQAYRVAAELIEQGAKKAVGRGAGAAGGALAGAAVGSVVP